MERIVIEKVSKKFKIGFNKKQGTLGRILSLFSGKEQKRIIQVLKDISLKINSKEIVGIIGENGSGKSTLLRIIARIYKKDEGRIKVNGKIISLINLNVGLKEKLTMKENIFLVGSLFGMSQKEIKIKFNSIVNFSELENFVNTKIYQFSTGMTQRLVFSIAIHSNPEILLLDEVFEVGDEEFRKKSSQKLKELSQSGMAIILVSHDLNMVEKYCNRILWLEKGEIIREGKPKEIIKEYIKGRKKINAVFLYGTPAVGKVITGKELSRRTGFYLFDGHKTQDWVYPMFSYGPEYTDKLLANVRLITFETAARHGISFIFTFPYSNPKHNEFYKKAKEIIERFNGKVNFVRLTCDLEENFRRVEAPERKQYAAKSLDRKTLKWNLEYENLQSSLEPIIGKHLEIDNTNLPVKKVADIIMKHYNLPLKPKEIKENYDYIHETKKQD